MAILLTSRHGPLFNQVSGTYAATHKCDPFLPLAIEYTFWEERTPEALIEFGEPSTDSGDNPKQTGSGIWKIDWQERRRALAEKAIARQPDRFDVLLDGSAGVGGFYDLARRIRSLVTAGEFESAPPQATREGS